MAIRGQALWVEYVAWDTSANGYVTGDKANHTIKWRKDGAGATTTNNGHASNHVELGNGKYAVLLTATEADCNSGGVYGSSSTANTVIIGANYTFVYLPTVAPASNGGLPTVNASNRVKADLETIGGESILTNTASLKLKTLDIRNSTGDAIHAESTGGDGYGGYFKGNGGAAGIFGGGGLTGHGFEGQGGNNGGAGALFQGTQDAGFKTFGGVGYPGMNVGDIDGDLLGDVNNVLFNVHGEVASIGSQGIDSIWDEPFEGTTTVRQALRGVFAVLLNKSSGHGSGASTPRYRDIADTKNRIDAVTDANGNRTTVTLDLT